MCPTERRLRAPLACEWRLAWPPETSDRFNLQLVDIGDENLFVEASVSLDATKSIAIPHRQWSASAPKKLTSQSRTAQPPRSVARGSAARKAATSPSAPQPSHMLSHGFIKVRRLPTVCSTKVKRSRRDHAVATGVRRDIRSQDKLELKLRSRRVLRSADYL